MIDSSTHKIVIADVANALGRIKESAVFVGGSVTALYVEENVADQMRPTKDLDIFLEIASPVELETLEAELRKKGFQRDPAEEVMCRFVFKGYLIDVMSTKEMGWAPANPWFELGSKDIITTRVHDETIRMLSLPYFLASKFTAFMDRGKDPRTSHDFEDIIFILDNGKNLVDLIPRSPIDVRKFLIGEFSRMLSEEDMIEAILAHLPPDLQTPKYNKIVEKLKTIIDG